MSHTHEPVPPNPYLGFRVPSTWNRHSETYLYQPAIICDFRTTSKPSTYTATPVKVPSSLSGWSRMVLAGLSHTPNPNPGATSFPSHVNGHPYFWISLNSWPQAAPGSYCTFRIGTPA